MGLTTRPVLVERGTRAAAAPAVVSCESPASGRGQRKGVVGIADVAQLAAEVLGPLGYELLEVQVGQGRSSTTVTVRIDRLDEQPVSVEDLERASGVLGLELDRLDPIPGRYKLEVESPGPKRPLTRARHFERMIGLKVKAKRQGGSLIGRIVAVDEAAVTLEDERGENVRMDLADIRATLAEWPAEHR